MAIVLDQKDLALLDKEYAADSQIWQPLTAGAKSITAADFDGVRDVRINKLGGLVDAVDYKRNQDNERKSVSIEKELIRLTQEDWFAYDTDMLDMSENGALTIQNIVTEQLRLKTIPKRDRFLAQKIFDTAKGQGGKQFVTDSIDKTNVLDAYDTAVAYMNDHMIPGGYIMFVSSDFYIALKNAQGVNRAFSVNQANVQGINRTVGQLDGSVPILQVSKNRLQGLAGDANGNINFMLVPLSSIAPIVKYDNVSVISPETDRGGNRWTIKGTAYYDAIVFDNAKESLYVAATPAKA